MHTDRPLRNTMIVRVLATALFATAACAAQHALAATPPVPADFFDEQRIDNPQPDADDQFGVTASLSDGTFAVGETFGDHAGATDAGVVHIYARSADGWVPLSIVTPGDPEPGDQFCSVALQGDRLLVGAARKNNKIGAAYVFERDPDGNWIQQEPKLEPLAPSSSCGDVQGCHLFGVDVALDGDTAIATAPTENDRRGAVYVFERQLDGTWQRTARLQALDGVAHDHFGNSVALQGDTLVVGADHDSIGTATNIGSAYVFVRNGGVWTQQARLEALDGGGGDLFGNSVDVSGDDVIVGAYRHAIGGDAARGAAYVFRRTGMTWAQQAKLQAASGPAATLAAFDQFGYQVKIRGNEAIATRFPGDFSLAAPDRAGSAHRFRRQGGTWREVEQYTPPTAAPGDGFGYSLDFDDTSIVVGSLYEGTDPEPTIRGAAYAYARSPSDRIFADDFEP